MTYTNFGLFEYNGVESYESFQMTDHAGVSPAVGVLRMFPQYGLPSEDGDIVLRYWDQKHGLQTIVFKDCHIDSIMYERGTGGKVVIVRFLDERWRWAFGEITGRYNYRNPDNWVNPDHEKTPQELATLCFEALGYGVGEFDVSALPNDARPDVDWDHANPAQELDKLVNELGCRIVPIRSTGKWKVCVTGEGSDLPDGYPYNDYGSGIDPVEVPDYIKVVTAPYNVQLALQLTPCGRDTDHSWRDLSKLSYCPNPRVAAEAWGFSKRYPSFDNLDANRVRQADGTCISPQELAEQTVLKSWRIDNAPIAGAAQDDQIYVSFFEEFVDRKQIILTQQLAQTYVDELGAEHPRPAFIWGDFAGPKADTAAGTMNYPPGTRIDYQGAVYRYDEEERASFSMSLDPIDTDRSIVTTSKQMVYDMGDGTFDYANLFLTCSCQIRDPVTWQPYRYEYFLQIGSGTDESFCLEVIKDEIQPYSIENYDEYGTFLSQTDNTDLVDQQCQYFAEQIQRTFQTVVSGTRTYIGLFPIDLDGAIQQVTYKTGRQGHDTIVSRGTEHDFDIPTYEERRQRTARKNNDEKIKYLQYKLDRQARQRGTFNT